MALRLKLVQTGCRVMDPWFLCREGVGCSSGSPARLGSSSGWLPECDSRSALLLGGWEVCKAVLVSDVARPALCIAALTCAVAGT